MSTSSIPKPRVEAWLDCEKCGPWCVISDFAKADRGLLFCRCGHSHAHIEPSAGGTTVRYDGSRLRLVQP